MKRFGFLFLVLGLAQCGSAPSSGQEVGRSGGKADMRTAADRSGPATASRSQSAVKTIQTEGSPSLGSEDASAVVTFWADFQ